MLFLGLRIDASYRRLAGRSNWRRLLIDDGGFRLGFADVLDSVHILLFVFDDDVSDGDSNRDAHLVRPQSR